jgi:hypothetical protein
VSYNWSGSLQDNGEARLSFLVLKGKQTMKRVLGITLALLSLGFVVPAAEAAEVSNQNSTVTTAANSAPQWERDRYGRRYNRRRSVRRTRLVRYGRRLYRETYVVTYWPNGRSDTRLISRTRVG